MEKLNNQLRLIETYKNLLSPKKKEYIEKYYFNDFSLNEIASSYNVSRTAVHQAIISGISELEDFERKMHLIKKQNERIEFIKSKINNEDIIKEYLDLEFKEN